MKNAETERFIDILGGALKDWISAKDLALRLYRDLHSSAGENFISSLISGAFNESAEFRKWILHDVGKLHRNLLESNFHASPNDLIPKCLRGSGEGKKYTRPDIVIWDRRQEDDWDNLYERTNVSWEVAGRTRAIFIELKWWYVSPDDRDKYLNFVSRIEKAPDMKFILVTSLYDKVIERIRVNPYHQWEKPLNSLLNSEHVVTISYEQVCNALGRSEVGGTTNY